MKILENSRMPKQTTPPKSAARGFTLIELMVTVAIVAILATIATTSYTTQIQKSRRTDARSALLDLAGREEKLFSTTNAYSATATDLGYSGAFPQLIGSNYYTVNVASPDPAQAAATFPTYAITATAVGPQLGDTQCLTLSVNQTGLQSSTPTTTPAATCWGN
jgi:type IV pilus assembly protein PilE